MRRPVRAAYRETMVALHQAYDHNILGTILWQAVLGMPRALRRRKVISPAVEKMKLLLDITTATLTNQSPDHRPACRLSGWVGTRLSSGSSLGGKSTSLTGSSGSPAQHGGGNDGGRTW